MGSRHNHTRALLVKAMGLILQNSADNPSFIIFVLTGRL
jgi:hypothetical protein